MAIAANHRRHTVVRVLRIAGVLLAAITTASCADLFYEKPLQSIVKTQENSKSAGARKTTPPVDRKTVASASAATPPTPATLRTIDDATLRTIDDNVRAEEKIKTAAASIAAELAANCPIADPADQTAFERCKSECRPEIYGGRG